MAKAQKKINWKKIEKEYKTGTDTIIVIAKRHGCATHTIVTHAKKGNWKRDNPDFGGRPSLYRPEYCQAIIAYFDIPHRKNDGEANTPPYFLNFCRSIKITKETMYNWAEQFPEFKAAKDVAQELQKQLMINNALTNGYNSSFAWRAMMNMHGWREKSDNIHTGKGGKSLFPDLSDAELDARIEDMIAEK